MMRSTIFALALLTPFAANAATPCASQAPFGIAAKPLPRATRAAEALPPKIGRFVRDAISKDAAIPSDEDFNTTYRAGRDTVFIGLSRPGSDADLREAVKTSRADAASDKRIDRRGERFCVTSSPYFYSIPDFLAWTRGEYFLYADASSPAILAEFMKAFPY